MSGENKGFWRRWWRWLRVILIGLGVCLLLLAGTRLFLLYKVRSAIAAIRDRGVPTTTSELAEMYGPAAGQNAVDPFKTAFAALRGDYYDAERLLRSECLPGSGESPSAETKWELAAWLAVNEERMSLVEKALAGGDCRLPMNIGYVAYSDPSGRLEQATRLFHARAAMAVEQRQPDAAVRAVLTQFALARALGDEAILACRAARIAILRRAVANIEAALNARILEDRHFAALDKALRDEEAHDGLVRIIQGERCRGIDAIQRTGGFGPVVPFIDAHVPISDWCHNLLQSMQYRIRRVMDLLLMRGGYRGGYDDSTSFASILKRSCDYAGFLQAY